MKTLRVLVKDKHTAFAVVAAMEVMLEDGNRLSGKPVATDSEVRNIWNVRIEAEKLARWRWN